MTSHPPGSGLESPSNKALAVMIPETLSQIEARVRQTGSLTEENKAELLKLLAALRTEIGDLARTKSDEAHRIAAIARNSTEAATHDQTNPELVKQSLDQLASAVSGFEESHPRLVEVVNRMASTDEKVMTERVRAEDKVRVIVEDLDRPTLALLYKTLHDALGFRIETVDIAIGKLRR